MKAQTTVEFLSHRLTLLLSLLCLMDGRSHASVIFVGTFEGNPGQGVGTVSGSFRATFDDSLIPSDFSGDREFALDSFQIDPNPIGTTTFDLTLVGGTVVYLSGEIVGVGIGGLTSDPGRAIALTSGNDDFAVLYLVGSDPRIDELSVTVASIPETIGTDFFPTGTLTVIPEPASLILVVVSSSFFVRRRRGEAVVETPMDRLVRINL